MKGRNWRQWRQHKAFRIAAPRWSGTEYDDLDRCLAELGDVLEQPSPDDDDDALAEAATNLWRARRKLAQGNDGQGKQAARYLRTCAEALATAGITVQDHDGEPFHAGRSVDVLLYSDDPEVTVETVVETVRPAVYHHDRRIQTAQVIVAVPATTHRPDSADSEDSHA
ncbi:hypothetical protein ACQPYH_09060 [Kribbella sp. CA-245084]|uniref:hypothetical protein n=1 Tax=Kribbella sp. CA-245084 TaxID=3239940 RepID=UPI003D8D9400